MARPIHVSRLVGHPANIRHNLGDLADLTASIRAQGILQPLLAEPRPDGKYTILAGHRRLAAAKQAGLEMVPVTVRRAATDQAKAIEVMLVENCQRRDLGPIEKAEAMGVLRDRGYTVTAIARAIGLAPSTVSATLALLDLDEASRERVRDGTVKAGDALKAVRRTRRAGGGRTGRPVHTAPAHFTGRHPLARSAQAMCSHNTRPVVGGVACGQCWEAAIREDAAMLPEEPETVAAPTRRQERMAAAAELRLHDSGDAVPPPGVLTAAMAAERLGVSPRTIARYKHDLAGAAS
jgi:ParB family chromosome partitioning protein